MTSSGREVYVVDSSSVAEVRRIMSDHSTEDLVAVFDGLTRLVENGLLVFPREVYDELESGQRSIKKGIDHVFEWAKACRDEAVPEDLFFECVREVLRMTPDLVDQDKVVGPDEADPYVVGLALHLA